MVIDAEGKHFSTGVEVGDHKPDKVDDMIGTFNRIFELLEQIDIPVIAVVQGFCLGGGMELAIACDVIVADKGASFGQPEIKVGFFPPYAAIRLPQLVGPAKAIEICTTGKFYKAQEAQSLGMVSHVADDGQLAGSPGGRGASMAKLAGGGGDVDAQESGHERDEENETGHPEDVRARERQRAPTAHALTGAEDRYGDRNQRVHARREIDEHTLTERPRVGGESARGEVR